MGKDGDVSICIWDFKVKEVWARSIVVYVTDSIAPGFRSGTSILFRSR